MIEKKITSLIDSHINSLGYELVGVEYLVVNQQSVLRVYVDSLDSNEPLQMNDCSKISNHISTILDVNDSLSFKYCLEVSSPGLDRPLFSLEHYRKAINKNIKVKLKLPIEGMINFKGKITGVVSEKIFLDVLENNKKKSIILLLDDIKKSNIIFDH